MNYQVEIDPFEIADELGIDKNIFAIRWLLRWPGANRGAEYGRWVIADFLEELGGFEYDEMMKMLVESTFKNCDFSAELASGPEVGSKMLVARFLMGGDEPWFHMWNGEDADGTSIMAIATLGQACEALGWLCDLVWPELA